MRHPQQLDMRAVQAMYPRPQPDLELSPQSQVSASRLGEWRRYALYASPGIVWTGAMIGLAAAVRW